MKKLKKLGFTIIELSIVLVIVGLLIGGILIGQNLIESAKISKEVNKLSQYSISFISFNQKFKQFAGDSTHFEPAGNNDKDVFDYSGSCPAAYVSERLSAWAHLKQAGMINENFVYNSNFICGANPQYTGVAPTYSRAGHFVSNYSATNKEPITYTRKTERNQTWSGYYTLFQMGYSSKLSYYIHPQLYMGIDKKLDDGVSSEGIVIGGFQYNEDGNYMPCGIDNSAYTDYLSYVNATNLNDLDCTIDVYFSSFSAPELPISAN